MEYLTIIVNILAFLGLIYWYFHKIYNHWSSRGVPGPKPIFLLGNLIDRFIRTGPDYEMNYFKRFGRVYGIYNGLRPRLSISDPELIKQVTIKEFPTFVNRKLNDLYHKVWNNNLFIAYGEDKWKRIRSITSPTFTTGKLKGMHSIMTRSVEKLEKYFEVITEGKNTPVPIDTKKVVSGFTIDVIASTTFATETDTNNAKNRDSQFLNNALGFFIINKVKLMFTLWFPRWVNDLFGIHYPFPTDNFNFFYDLTKAIVRSRTENGIKRNDLVDLLLNASTDHKTTQEISYDKLTATMDEGNDEGESNQDLSIRKSNVKDYLSEDEIIAQCIIFFVAGFETTATTLTYIIYELALNQDIQERLARELNEALADFNDPYSSAYYDKVNSGIPYLEAVIKETLRKYPPVVRLNREAGKDTKVGGIELRKGDQVEISVYAVHHDPDNYPEPERWNPDRFMPENKSKLIPYTFLPFGNGPRNCVGMRFAYQEIKIAVANFVQRFRFTPNKDTPKEIQYRIGLALTSPIHSSVSVSRR